MLPLDKTDLAFSYSLKLIACRQLTEENLLKTLE
jgi:hypothetical protein